MLRIKIFTLDLNFGFLLDVIALFATRLNLFSELGQTFGVKGVVRIEEFLPGLIEAGERHRFKFKAVFQDVFRNRRLHFLDEIDALFVQLLHRHFGCHGAQGVDELAFDELL